MRVGIMEQRCRDMAAHIANTGAATLYLYWRENMHGEQTVSVKWGGQKLSFAGGAGYNKRKAALEDALRFVECEYKLVELTVTKNLEMIEVTKC